MRRLQELIGPATDHLVALIEAGRIPHALLFEGPEGTGKFVAARLFAMTLLCHDRQGAEPCGRCGSCLKVEAQSHADLMRLTTEEKSIKIAQVREFERALQLRPVEGNIKFLLIEDAHRITPQAQNALLKTLEEPPGNAHIILTTARLRAILPTVVSRCQRVAFRPVPLSTIAKHLVHKHEVSEEHAQMIAALSQGSLGAAVRIASEDLEELLERRDRIAALDEQLCPSQSPLALDALELAGGLAEDRKTMLKDLELLLVWLHDQMVIASEASNTRIANSDQGERLERMARTRGLKPILERTRSVMSAKRQLELPFNMNAQMLAEELCLALSGHSTLQRIER